ncbi:MAG: thiamine pyrophosphate-dependent enzyme, partial [Candidatus Caldarchaeum sp.]|nr:thiamine pyrophosphate-dependent enzyme [Candidatus Caldarchaeum sp.]
LLLRIYRDMMLARLFDQTMVRLQRAGKIAAYTSSEGQEAISVAAAHAARPSDWIFPTYRETGAFVARGVPLEVLAARQLARVGDPLKGHEVLLFGDRRYRVVTGPGPVGAHVPVAVGFGLAAKRKGEDTVVLVFFGDGATSKGDLHEGFNFAGVFKAPAVFICQNNQYAISVPVSSQTASENIAVKAEAYGVAGRVVDGNDVSAVYGAVSEAIQKARLGEGPTLVEAVTYRLAAHSTADDQTKYRPMTEVERWRKNDPLIKCRNLLIRRNIWDSEKDQTLRQELAHLVYEKIEAAEKMPPLHPLTIFEDVYSANMWHLDEEKKELERLTKP